MASGALDTVFPSRAQEMRIYWSQGQKIVHPEPTPVHAGWCVALLLISAASELPGRDGILCTAIPASDMLVL